MVPACHCLYVGLGVLHFKNNFAVFLDIDTHDLSTSDFQHWSYRPWRCFPSSPEALMDIWYKIEHDLIQNADTFFSILINIALVQALRIWVALGMHWHIPTFWGLCNILVKMSNFVKFFFAFFNSKGLAIHVVKILALKFEN